MLLYKGFRDVIAHSFFVVMVIMPCLNAIHTVNAYNYTFALRALANGSMLQNASSTPGAMWLNVRGFSPDELPYIQNNLGVHSLDAYDEMRMVAALAIMAAKYERYGDLIYLYSLFKMNAAFGTSSVDKPAMKEALWKAATGIPVHDMPLAAPSPYLLDLYASTATSSRLSRVFEEFKKWNGTARDHQQGQQGLMDDFNATISHAASLMTCSGLLTLLKDGRMSPKYGGPRSVCYSSCCLSWNGNAVFQWQDVLSDIQEYCLDNPTLGTTSLNIEARPSHEEKKRQDETAAVLSKRGAPHQVRCRLQSLIANGQQFNICMGNKATNCA